MLCQALSVHTLAGNFKVLYHANRVSHDKNFTAVYLRMNTGWSAITSLRRVAFIGMAHAPEVLDAEHKRTLDYLVSEGHLQKIFVGMKDVGSLEKTGNFLGTSRTGLVLQNASGSVDAASLVFAHTILDDALSSFVEMTAEVAPAFWQKRVEKRTFELAKLADHSREELVGMAVRDEVWRVRFAASVREVFTAYLNVDRTSSS